MIETHETVEFYELREKFKKAIKDECKEIGSVNCLLTVATVISELSNEDTSNIYNHKELSDACLKRKLEFYDACKQKKPEYTSFYDGRTEKKMMYLVTFDPYNCYGDYIYALGLYSSKDAAEKAISDFKEKFVGKEHPGLNKFELLTENDVSFTISEIEPDKTYEMKIGEEYDFELFKTDIFLGGYAE